MKKFTILALIATLLSVATVVKAASNADDLAVGDPYTEGENPVRKTNSHVKKAKTTDATTATAKKTTAPEKAAAAQEVPNNDAK